jgi:hypothetical protein
VAGRDLTQDRFVPGDGSAAAGGYRYLGRLLDRVEWLGLSGAVRYSTTVSLHGPEHVPIQILRRERRRAASVRVGYVRIQVCRMRSHPMRDAGETMLTRVAKRNARTATGQQRATSAGGTPNPRCASLVNLRPEHAGTC